LLRRGARLTVPMWLQDTIARRFALSAVLAVGVTLVLILLFDRFGGIWSQGTLQQKGLLHEAIDIVRLVDSAPPSLRPTLCEALTNNEFRANWYADGSDAASALEASPRASGATVDALLRHSAYHSTVVFSPSHRQELPPGLIYEHRSGRLPYVLAVKLKDRSWLAFTAENRTWGLPPPIRWAIGVLFLATSIALVTLITARQFSKPIAGLAEAAREFGHNSRAWPIFEEGPKEVRQVIRTFNEMRSQIQAFVSRRTTMLAAISHDLRTPLTRIRLRGEFIEEREQQTRLFRDVDEMQAMVDGALAFFRDEAIAEATTTLDLPHVIVAITNDYADQGINIAYQGPVHGIYLGRPFALKRALTNLIENAVKYGTPPEIELVNTTKTWDIIIKDRGPGIPPESLESVFRPYYRLDKARSRTMGGVGLGLTAAQTIIQGHGGQIVLANRDGGGLEARVTLPTDHKDFA
jgi:signal transduction histidine kinase